jgi:hypothetical protein
MLTVLLVSYVSAAVIAYVWCAATAQRSPHPDWIWDKLAEEQHDDNIRAA